MVLGEEEHVLLFIELDKACAKQRTTGQIEGGVSFFGDEFMQLLSSIWDAAQIVLEPGQADVWGKELDTGLAVDGDKDTAQGFVAGQDGIKAAAQNVPIQISAQTQR